ncbi:MAG: (2Fe-2S)-binding protein [Acidobacteria bacterium]|nr:(2Fe-2S)-binding protein [Acidobacteriota bacterium]
MSFTLLVNGAAYSLDVPPEETLLSVIRERLGLTGSKYGCGEGRCGACTVLIEGSPVRSCSMKIGAAAGKTITTIEGLASGGSLHPVQQAFLEKQAFQCGYCTPGMILSALALLEHITAPTSEQIGRYLDGNVCRCGTYPRIIEAVHAAALSRSKPNGKSRG